MITQHTPNKKLIEIDLSLCLSVPVENGRFVSSFATPFWSVTDQIEFF